VVFLTVALSTMWLRSSRPDLARPFRVPLGGVWVGRKWIGTVPVLSILFTLLMMAPVLTDIVYKAARGDWIPAAILLCYIVAGALLYALYGLRKSRLGQAWLSGDAAAEAAAPGPGGPLAMETDPMP
jgi:APA family basic amino acid/polyamine antiporter